MRSSTTDRPPATEIDLGFDEQWAVHGALTDYADVASRDDTDLPQPTVELALVEKIEDGEFTFTAYELDRLRYQCEFHAERVETGERDRTALRSVVERIDRRCPTETGR